MCIRDRCLALIALPRLQINAQLYTIVVLLATFTPVSYTHLELIPNVPKSDERPWTVGMSRFVDACHGKGEAVANGEDGLKILRLLDATNRSAAEKREITL